MEQHFYRAPWTQERVAFLVEWWPHFGSVYIADQLGLTVPQVKAKVNKLRLRLRPRAERLCVRCRVQAQYSRTAGLLCRSCYQAQRQESRRARAAQLEAASEAQQQTALQQWIAKIVALARNRSPVPADITPAYMFDLWQRQEGRCFYSGRELRVPRYGTGRNLFAPSIDRLDPQQGYVQGNVVWAALVCNFGKNLLSVVDYIQLCADVVAQHLELVQGDQLIGGEEGVGRHEA